MKPGTKIDRYGGAQKGEFLSPQGTPFEQRSLPAGHQATKEYHQYEVVKDLPVQAGKSAPWFGQPGGGTQFRLADGWTVEGLIEKGYIKEIGP